MAPPEDERLTDTGQAFYERCRAMLAEAEQAEALVVQAQAEPHGRIRFSCPTGMVELISGLISSFLLRYPKVRLQFVATDRAVDLIEERIGVSTRILVASPQIASQIAGIEQLATLPSLATDDAAEDLEWYLESEDGRKHVVRVQPRMGCEDMATVREAAIAGLGLAILPDHVCRAALDAGQLVRVLPAWRGLQGIVHLVFTTRRGIPPAVRALIDHLATGFPREGV